jgi:hypothetical protein
MKSIKLGMLLGILLAFPLALAVSVSVDPVDVVADDAVTLTVTGCDEGVTSFIRVYSPGEDSNLIDIFQGAIESGQFRATHIANSDSGTYEVRGSCEGDGNLAKKNFCVDTTCTTAVAEEPKKESTKETGPSGGGGGGGVPSRTFTACLPSWVCKDWSECADGKRTRVCFDEKKCNKDIGKPILESSCSVVVQETKSMDKKEEQEVTSTTPNVQEPSVAVTEKSSSLKWIIVGVALVVLIGIIVGVVMHKRKLNAGFE